MFENWIAMKQARVEHKERKVAEYANLQCFGSGCSKMITFVCGSSCYLLDPDPIHFSSSWSDTDSDFPGVLSGLAFSERFDPDPHFLKGRSGFSFPERSDQDLYFLRGQIRILIFWKV